MRRLTDEHGERGERPEGDQLEFHHAGDAQRKFLQELVRFGRAGRVHDEDDAVALGLEEPLLDLSGEMVANCRADFVGQDRRSPWACPWP